MKKIFLATLAMAGLALAGCSNSNSSTAGVGDYKHCSYLMIGDQLLVNEDGPTKSVKMVATYTIDVDDYEEISSSYISGLPTSFNVIVNSYVVTPSRISQPDRVAPETCPLNIRTEGASKSYTMTLKANSTSFYETYGENFLYSESARTVKLIQREDVRSPASQAVHESAYTNYIEVMALTDDVPSDTFRVTTPVMQIGERSYERIISIGSNVTCVYRFEPELQA